MVVVARRSHCPLSADSQADLPEQRYYPTILMPQDSSWWSARESGEVCPPIYAVGLKRRGRGGSLDEYYESRCSEEHFPFPGEILVLTL